MERKMGRAPTMSVPRRLATATGNEATDILAASVGRQNPPGETSLRRKCMRAWRGSICIGVVQSMQRCRQPPLLLGAPTHSHTEQRSPRADKSSGRTRNESGDGCTWEKEEGKEGECHAENAKYLFSSRVPLLSSSEAASRQSECLREHWRGVAGVQ